MKNMKRPKENKINKHSTDSLVGLSSKVGLTSLHKTTNQCRYWRFLH